VVGVPAILVLAFKIWPKTAIGRRVLLTAPEPEDVLPTDPLKERLKGLVGKVARAKSKMLLSGVITVNGETIDAVSESTPIEPGQKVRVIAVRGNRVVVRPVEQDLPSETAENPLLRPIEDPFDNPPT
jgi:membrane-bound serine protease (ClpP class)